MIKWQTTDKPFLLLSDRSKLNVYVRCRPHLQHDLSQYSTLSFPSRQEVTRNGILPSVRNLLLEFQSSVKNKGRTKDNKYVLKFFFDYPITFFFAPKSIRATSSDNNSFLSLQVIVNDETNQLNFKFDHVFPSDASFKEVNTFIYGAAKVVKYS